MEGSVTLTELRQRLFGLADRVIETGEPLVIERRGTRLRLVREDATVERGGRIAQIRPRMRSVVVGPPIDPHESLAQWDGTASHKVAEPQAPDRPAKPIPRKRRSST